MRRIVVLSALFSLFALAANASTILVNFETLPVLPTGPSTFAAAGPAQTIIVPNVATFTGGVVLGNETNLPAQSFGTAPNVYGTADFGTSLSSTLTITISSLFPTTEVSFPLFNGETSAQSYVVTAFNGATIVATQNLLNLPSNGSSGFGIVDLTAANITSVTITPTVTSSWDFSIDSIALNEPVQQAFGPEPATFIYLGLGLACTLFMRARQYKI
jgi:hypothetical protein